MKYWILAIFLFMSSTIDAQIFRASTDAEKLFQDSYLTVVFELKNAEGNSFSPPDFDGFDIVGGPSSQNSTRIINGQRSSSYSITYELRPKRSGQIVIDPATILVRGKKVTSNSLSINVLPRKKSSKINEDVKPYYIILESSDSVGYVGQQINLIYKLFFKVNQNVRTAEIKKESDFDGFFAQNMNVKSSTTREIIKNEEYFVSTIRGVALFPQTAGNFEISPASFTIFIPDNRRQGFFFNSYKRVPYTTNGLNILIKNLPSNPPPNYNGAIGKYSLKAQLKNNKITTDDAATLYLEISGNGDSKKVLAPVLDFGPDIEVYDPNLIKEDLTVQNQSIYHKNVYEYLLVPKKAKNYRIKPTVSYFNTDSAVYQTLETTTPNLVVRQGTGKSILDDSKALADQHFQLAPLATSTSLRPIGKSFFKSIFYWIILGIFALGLMWILFQKKKLIELEGIDPEKLKLERATKVAIQKLTFAERLKNDGDHKGFFNEVSKAMLTFISDKLGIPPSEISKSNVADKLNALQVDHDTNEKFVSILKSCELALFAGQKNQDQMQEAYDNSLTVLSSIERQIPST